MAERALKLLIAGDASGALKALGQTGDASDGLGSKLKTMGKVAAAGFAAAGVAAIAFGKSAVEAAAESQKISKVTEQIVKSTQGAAKISADEVSKLATALSNKTGIDDEAIQSAQNLILTFKNVRNEVGKGNDIFNRASALALDLSTVMGGDASGAAMQLAKALDNPTKGVTALTRSGVSFTAQQKEQIKTLVESGKTLEAQKIILKEVESQVGGTAAAQATAADRAKVAFGNLQEQIGGYLLPVVEKVSNFLVTTFIPKLSELAERYGPMVGAAFQRLGEIMKPVFEWLQVNVPIIFDKVKGYVSEALTAIMGFWNKHKDDILRIVGIYWEYIKTTVENGIRIVKGVIDVFLGLLQGDWGRVWDGLKGIVSGALNQVGNIIRTAGTLLLEAAKYAFDKVVEGAVLSSKLLWRMLTAFPEVVKGFFLDAATWLLKAGGDLVDGLVKGIDNNKWKIVKKASDISLWVTNPLLAIWKIRSPSRLFMEYGEYLGDGLVIGIDSTKSSIEQAAMRMASAVSGPMAGEAARLGKETMQAFAIAMAGEAARSGTTIYKPLVAAMAGEAARNGNDVAKPLFAAMAGEAARNGAAQISGALRTHLEVQARELGYDLGTVLSEEITGSLEDVISKMSKKISDNIGAPFGGAGGGGGGGGAAGTIGGGGGGATLPANVADLYNRFGGQYGDWARKTLGELTDWNSKWNPAGSPQVRPFAPNPISGGTLLDANGNPVYADDVAAVRDALQSLAPAMAAGGIVTSPTLALIGEAGPEAVVPLNRGGYGGDVYVNVTGSVISERDLVDSIRKALIVDQQRGKILIPTY